MGVMEFAPPCRLGRLVADAGRCERRLQLLSALCKRPRDVPHAVAPSDRIPFPSSMTAKQRSYGVSNVLEKISRISFEFFAIRFFFFQIVLLGGRKRPIEPSELGPMPPTVTGRRCDSAFPSARSRLHFPALQLCPWAGATQVVQVAHAPPPLFPCSFRVPPSPNGRKFSAYVSQLSWSVFLLYVSYICVYVHVHVLVHVHFFIVASQLSRAVAGSSGSIPRLSLRLCSDCSFEYMYTLRASCIADSRSPFCRALSFARQTVVSNHTTLTSPWRQSCRLIHL